MEFGMNKQILLGCMLAFTFQSICSKKLNGMSKMSSSERREYLQVKKDNANDLLKINKLRPSDHPSRIEAQAKYNKAEQKLADFDARTASNTTSSGRDSVKIPTDRESTIAEFKRAQSEIDQRLARNPMTTKIRFTEVGTSEAVTKEPGQKVTITTSASDNEKKVDSKTTVFIDPFAPAAIETKPALIKKKAAEVEDIGVVKQQKPTVVGGVEIPANIKAPSPDVVAQWKKESDTKKATSSIVDNPPVQTFVVGKKPEGKPQPGAVLGAQSQAQSLPPIAASTNPPDEAKPGMSGKKKAGVGLVAAGGVGLAAAGLVSAGVLATSGDKDKPASEIAPEKVEDIKGLDAGSGLDQSFEPSPISN